MEFLLSLILWAGFFFLVMRMGSRFNMLAPEQERRQNVYEPGTLTTTKTNWVAPEKEVDPVCKKTISTRNAKSCVHAGHAYYFCSRDCREIFEAAPELYLDAPLYAGNTPTQKLEHSHV